MLGISADVPATGETWPDPGNLPLTPHSESLESLQDPASHPGCSVTTLSRPENIACPQPPPDQLLHLHHASLYLRLWVPVSIQDFLTRFPC